MYVHVHVYTNYAVASAMTKLELLYVEAVVLYDICTVVFALNAVDRYHGRRYWLCTGGLLGHWYRNDVIQSEYRSNRYHQSTYTV